jgi:hypothetical protein
VRLILVALVGALPALRPTCFPQVAAHPGWTHTGYRFRKRGPEGDRHGPIADVEFGAATEICVGLPERGVRTLRLGFRFIW